jgi:rubredoxin
MPDPRECPMCGAMMRLNEIDTTVRVVGYTEKSTRQVREWTCPECEYFEEVDND